MISVNTNSTYLSELNFDRPEWLVAHQPKETEGARRDAVKLLVSTPNGHHHTQFASISNFLEAGDLLVVNDSGTLPASLPAKGRLGDFIVNLSTDYGDGLWVLEPRQSYIQPGPLPLNPNETVEVDNVPITLLAPYPKLPRLWFAKFHLENSQYKSVQELTLNVGKAIRYGYVDSEFDLAHYQTFFADKVGSAEMPSAARPFTASVVKDLEDKGIQIAAITLHTGVSSLEIESETIEDAVLYPEPFEVTKTIAKQINQTREQGGRIIAVGTTVVRALESAYQDNQSRQIVATKGFTKHYIHPQKTVHSIDGLITGLHDPKASHLAMLYTIAGKTLIQEAYQEAIAHEYLWHEFGDSHLILPKG